MKFVKIGSKYINVDIIPYVDIEEMTIYLNAYDGLNGVYYDIDDFNGSEEFENAIMKAFNKYENGNTIFKQS